MILQDYVRIVRRGAWLLVALVVVGAAAGFAFAATATPTYFTRATVMVSATGDTTPGGLAQASSFAVQRTPTYAGLGQTSVVLESAVAQLGDGTTLAQLAEADSLQVVPTVRPPSGLPEGWVPLDSPDQLTF